MSKKPPLTLVGSGATLPAPPRKLGRHGLALWNRVQGEYAIADVGGVEMLMQGCALEERAEGLATEIARDGEVIRLRNGVPKAHPAIRDEIACRLAVCRILTKLGITLEPIAPVGRPNSGLGIGWEQLEELKRGD